MRENNILKETLQAGLARLDAERLPSWVTERLASDFTTKAESNLRRLAAREITNKKIARIFAAGGREGKEGSRGETAVSPPGEQGPANEVRQGL
jgi:hypothetical protein